MSPFDIKTSEGGNYSTWIFCKFVLVIKNVIEHYRVGLLNGPICAKIRLQKALFYCGGSNAVRWINRSFLFGLD